MILLDVLPPPFSNPVSIAAGIGFFFILTAVAVAIFLLLKRSVHVGIRLIIVAVILLIGVIGGLAISIIADQRGHKPTRPPE